MSPQLEPGTAMNRIGSLNVGESAMRIVREMLE
jgi:hypothetical protein